MSVWLIDKAFSEGRIHCVVQEQVILLAGWPLYSCGI